MYDNYAGSRTVIAYNFLGSYVNELSKEELQAGLEYIGLNGVLDDINTMASEQMLSVDDTINMIYEVLEDYIYDYEEDFEEEEEEHLSPILEDVVLVDVHDYDHEGVLRYDVYSFDGEDLSELVKEHITSVLNSIKQDDILNTNVIIIFVDIVQFGKPICKLVFNNIL